MEQFTEIYITYNDEYTKLLYNFGKLHDPTNLTKDDFIHVFIKAKDLKIIFKVS